jgi:putative methionine-R-sulfoxide reductase with GAF domain
MFKKLLNHTHFRLYSLLFLLIIIVSFLTVFILSFFKTISENAIFNNYIIQFSIKTVDYKNAVNEFRDATHKSDLFELKKNTYSEKVFNLIEQLKDINNECITYSQYEFYELLPLLKQNETVLSESFTHFELYVQNTVEIGNDEYGYIQNLLFTEKRALNNLSDHNELYTDFLDIIKTKKNYLSTLNIEFSDDLKTKIKEIIQKIQKYNFQNPNDQKILKDIVLEYSKLVNQIDQKHKILGNKYYNGLYQKIMLSSDELLFNTDQIAKEVLLFHLQQSKSFRIKIILLMGIVLLLIIFTTILVHSAFLNGLKSVRKELRKLSFSDFKFEKKQSGDVINSIKNEILTHKNLIKEKTEFVNKLVNEEAVSELKIARKDKLGKALESLRLKLEREHEERESEKKQRIKEDKQKEGIAKFGRILRRHTGDIDSLSYELISELVRYINADIGGIYIIDKIKDETILKLRASFAYDEQKMLAKDIPFGEGIIGTCAMDKSTFYYDTIDEDYIKIVSGFGHSKPSSLIVSPILVDEDVYGVLELASTKTFSIDDIEFIEILAEDIAYTYSYLLSLEQAK